MELTSRLKEIRYRQNRDSYMVWLHAQNRYLLMKEPAFWLLKQYREGANPADCVPGLRRKYSLPKDEASRFSREMHQSLIELCSEQQEENDPRLPGPIQTQEFKVYSVKYIRIYREVYRFSFGNQQLEQYIYPLLSHLECEAFPAQCNGHFEVFIHEKRVYLRHNQAEEYAWALDQAHKMKGWVFLQLISSMYHVRKEDWLGVIHASSVTLGKSALMFPAQPGSGKSTLASLLMAHGCKLVSDDFTPVLARDQSLYTFPGMISVKSGSLPVLSAYYPELKQVSASQHARQNKRLSYLTPELAENCETAGFPARAIVFVRYNATAVCEITQLSHQEALNSFLSESWIASHPPAAESFMDWFFATPCISLCYGDTGRAIEYLMGLLRDDA